MADEITDLQREWRQIVLQKLDALERGQRRLEDDVVAIRTGFADGDDLRDIARRVSALEEFKNRAIGIVLVIQLALGLGVALITHYITRD